MCQSARGSTSHTADLDLLVLTTSLWHAKMHFLMAICALFTPDLSGHRQEGTLLHLLERLNKQTKLKVRPSHEKTCPLGMHQLVPCVRCTCVRHLHRNQRPNSPNGRSWYVIFRQLCESVPVISRTSIPFSFRPLFPCFPFATQLDITYEGVMSAGYLAYCDENGLAPDPSPDAQVDMTARIKDFMRWLYGADAEGPFSQVRNFWTCLLDSLDVYRNLRDAIRAGGGNRLLQVRFLLQFLFPFVSCFGGLSLFFFWSPYIGHDKLKYEFPQVMRLLLPYYHAGRRTHYTAVSLVVLLSCGPNDTMRFPTVFSFFGRIFCCPFWCWRLC